MDLFSGSFGCFNPVAKDAESDPQATEDKIKIWVLKCSRTGRVHYLEAHKDFVDLLLGFLMLRTGALIKVNREVSPVTKQVRSNAGIYGVYDSFKRLDDSVVIVDKDILLDPFEKLRVSEELQSLNSGDFECCNEDCFKYLARSRQICRNCTISTHFSCSACGGYFPENAHTALCYTPWRPWRNHMTAAPVLTRYTVIQSRSATPNRPKKVGYVKNNIPFIITNDLSITPFSTSNVAKVLENCGAGSCQDLECNELLIGTPEVLVMVGAALTSSTPLTDVFGKMCNKQTRVFSSTSFSQLPPFEQMPPSHDHGYSSIIREPSVLVEHEMDLRHQAEEQIPLRNSFQQESLDESEPTLQRKFSGCLSCWSPKPEERPKQQSFQELLVGKETPGSQPTCVGRCSSRVKPQLEKIPTQLSFEELPHNEKDGSLSTMQNQVEQIPRQPSFQELPLNEKGKEPEAQFSITLDGCNSSNSQNQSEETPTQLSVQEQPAPDEAILEPHTTSTESPFIEVSDFDIPPEQSVVLERCLENTSKSHPMEQTESPPQRPFVPSEEVLCEEALMTRTPYSQTFIRRSTRVSSQHCEPQPPCSSNSQSIVNPLFQQTSPADGPLLTSSQPPRGVMDRPLPRTRPHPRPMGCVPHSITHAPSIVRRSYPLARCKHGRTSVRHAVRFSNKHCPAHGIGSFPSVSAAFEQGSSQGKDCTDGQRSESDGSDHSSFLN